jgi:hypothetical protein
MFQTYGCFGGVLHVSEVLLDHLNALSYWLPIIIYFMTYFYMKNCRYAVTFSGVVLIFEPF